MCSKLLFHKHVFKHNTDSRLVSGIPISPHRILLFYSNGRYFQYDMCEDKIQRSLVIQKPVKVALLSQSQLIILTQSRKLARLDLQRNVLTDICRVPKVASGDQTRDKNTAYSTQIYPFIKSNSFYIKEIVEEENKVRIVYFAGNCEKHQIKQFTGINVVIEPINEESLMAMYKQHTDQDKKWEIRVFDLNNNFQQRKYIVDHKSLIGTATVVKTLMKCQDQMLIFVNGQNPEVLILNLERGDIREMTYKPQTNFIDVGFFNREAGLMELIFLAHSETDGKVKDNLIELVDIERGKVMERRHLTVGSVQVSLDRKFVLDCSEGGNSGNTSTFYVRHLINKRSLYIHLMHRSQILESYGRKICSDVIRVLQQL